MKIKTSLFFINNINKRLLKNMLINKNSFNIKDLKLINIIIIKGFYVNIILKVKFKKKKVWYNKLNYFLKIKIIKKNKLLYKFIKKFNLIFL